MKTLVIVTGPTASGKTSLAIELAETLDTEIVSADSRQLFRGLPIGTAAPTPEELARVRHHLVGVLDLHDYYSAARFEEDALAILDRIWQKSDYAVMCGGSMMYIDAITKGIDQLPTISQEIRDYCLELYEKGGLPALHERLRQLDPAYLAVADLSNHRRLVHAIEICLQAGVPYSSLRTGQAKSRPFRTVKLAINHDRQSLFDRINRRVGLMIAEGLEEEARKVYPLRHLNSLNTVGYKELFAMMDGIMDRETAIARIAKNTRVYAKKQLLWLSKDPDVKLLDPAEPLLPQALRFIN
ncbi:tRNA (adenosine(37)-N6)-dimethylallyltransferase MiaA [uncultured Duncaniella sp.]|uniref:tRNA (adenosine(37)-N6)-dimethylallyltransferase MiaA n=2 Tax=uncultured Duncaniella sp. TaxID=2768039 RepID=UPI0025E47E24|nr:tRNA (adenosine(37)-N6)-dimethylallyltransferase MiaA [uncultured Duncaniella sp.]